MLYLWEMLYIRYQLHVNFRACNILRHFFMRADLSEGPSEVNAATGFLQDLIEIQKVFLDLNFLF